MKKTLHLKKALRVTMMVLLLSVVGMVKGYAQVFSVDDLKYSVNEDGVSVTVSGENGMYYEPLVIPESVEYHGVSYAVTAIGDYAFSSWNTNTGLSGELIIPNSIVRIGESAFEGCLNITRLTIGNSVVEIGDNAFGFCEGLEGDLVIPNSVTTIGEAAFCSCRGLTGSLTLGNSIVSIGNSAFSECGFTGELVLPSSVTRIGNGAFYNCYGFTGPLVIPNAVTKIGDYAFGWCSGFTGELVIPNSVTKIGDYAFYLCSGFTGSLVIPNSVVTIGECAFGSCYGFYGSSLTLGSSVTTIGPSAFGECGFVGDLVIPRTVTTIGNWAFSGFDLEHVTVEQGNTVYDSRGDCNAIIETATNTLITGSSNTVIPNTVVAIAEAAFYYNGALTAIEIPNSVRTIGNNAFYGCTNLTSVNISKSVTSIGICIFSYCENLGQLTVAKENPVYDSRDDCNAIIETRSNTLVQGCKGTVIPNSVVAIGEYAFFCCSGFTGSLTIPDNVTTIGSDAFGFCSGFTGSLNLGNSITTIGSGAFRGLGVTGDLVIPNSVTTIGDLAFEYCPGLTGSLTLGKSVATIGNAAFMSCGFASMVSLAETPPVLFCEDFYDGDCYYFPLSTVTVPCGCVSAYEASDWSDFFTTISEDCAHYAIRVENTAGGTVSTSVSSAMLGEEVSVSFVAEPGYKLSSITVCKADDATMTVPCHNNSFVMPGFDVVVKASFSATSVDENSDIAVSVSPNPTSGNVRIEASHLRHISIFNALGQQVYGGQVDGDVIEYDFGGHEAGIYFVRMETASGVVVKRVVVTF